MKLHVCEDLEEGRQLWKDLWPDKDVFDCWQVRHSFQQAFGRSPHFIVAEALGRPVGLLALSWIEEEGYYGCFPGETWQGKTWLEQNRIPAMSRTIRQGLWEAAPENTELRYLHDEMTASLPGVTMDEVGYIFYPQRFKYDYNAYWGQFSGKSRRQIRRETEKFEAMGCRYHVNEWDDIGWMFEMNLATFKQRSYFHDSRFLNGFDAMLSFLAEQGMLRVTTIRIKGHRAAVDVGAVYRNHYTVLAGATDPEFLGIAKAINLFHLKWGCSRRFEQIDFLCGDFGWKARFHLQPRPLYQVNKTIAAACVLTATSERRAKFVAA
ncbi:MAG: GNAT family N-acetyltransferase [Alphaproteobacteria bacterium]|nr:GNAT family N-acetyltransferase [Alphaproteobacteria bacterium]